MDDYTPNSQMADALKNAENAEKCLVPKRKTRLFEINNNFNVNIWKLHRN